jgi:hypothetical protein
MGHYVLGGTDLLKLAVSCQTKGEFLAGAVVRLYERDRGESFGSPLVGLYVGRWVRWSFGNITYRTKEANAVPWDVMPKWCG